VEQELITKSYTLTQAEIDTIELLAKDKSLSASSALRLIIREWAEMRKEYVTVPAKLVADKKFWDTPEGIEQSR
jgi:hypothetical protein